jgi:hypothetical protein
MVRIDGNCRRGEDFVRRISHNVVAERFMSAQLLPVVPLVPEPATRGLILHVDDDEGLRRAPRC